MERIPREQNYIQAAKRLHEHIETNFWNGEAISGPDPIGKINWRITRFLKSYSRWLPWNSSLVYLQGQSYWVKANIHLFDLTKDERYLDMAGRSADFILKKQLASGAWEHPPIRGRKGFTSAVESIWASLGLLSAYRKLGNEDYLAAALRGYDAVNNVIGFQSYEDSLGVNYYAHSKHLVPNVTTMFLWFIAELTQITGDKEYLANSDQMVRFLRYSQTDAGELQYVFGTRPHFQCFQYNAFQFVDLLHFYRITGDGIVRTILTKMATFLCGGLTRFGSCRYDCFKETPEVNYWTSALARALRMAHELGLGDYLSLSELAYSYLLTRQRQDGGFDFSKRNYRILRDAGSYPRYQAMILEQILYRAGNEPYQVPFGSLEEWSGHLAPRPE